jgi:F-type H+-transporting ATPase subunit b
MTWINFLILFVVLRKLLFLPLLEIQEKRKKRGQASQDYVNEYMREIKILEKQYHDHSMERRIENNAIINQARQTALLDKKRKKIEEEEKILLQLEETRALMEKEMQAARSTLPQRTSVLASQIMIRILNRTVVEEETPPELSLNGTPHAF